MHTLASFCVCSQPRISVEALIPVERPELPDSVDQALRHINETAWLPPVAQTPSTMSTPTHLLEFHVNGSNQLAQLLALAQGRVLYLTTYSPGDACRGGAAWVDTRILEQIRAVSQVRVMAVVDGDQGDIPLSVRRRPRSLAATGVRMLRTGEPYLAAKFTHAPGWTALARRLRAHIDQYDTLITSQWPALLLSSVANVEVDVHVAHNLDSQLSQEYSPRVLRLMRDTRRLERLERRLVKRPGRVLALSRHDVIRLQAWGVAADHLPVPLHHYSSSRTRTPRQASTIGFIGKLDWPPNRRAVGSLLDEVLPRLKERMGTAAPRVVIAGAGSEDMSHYDSVVGLGVVATVSSFYDAVDVVVVPRFGTGESGVSVKMLEALEHAKVVIAPRALAAAAGVEGRIIPADSPDEVVEAIVSLTPTT